ncbi:uncharacterized protein LOC130238907 [Danio aesculapii]|uniref:uncharacterized protein LOC130238907 n=1 Tax=Danio aesculapii TaxID=1142201 RepID=UPI0024C09242|nr:uncharacterized protein LOC130238907 [Danio aesculapii]
MSLSTYEDLIMNMYVNGHTDTEISYHLSELGVQRGNSERNLRKFRSERGVKRKSISDEELELAVSRAVIETGPYYGRKMMTGYLAAQGVQAAEVRVGQKLAQMHEPYHRARCQGAKNLNPVPYNAEYVGHKLHMDQNEKLCMFGVTHVIAIDGFSKKIVGHSTMPIKNNLTIYEEVYRNAVISHGMWDQVRVDHGTEFYLTLFMQEMLAEHRHNQQRLPYLQTTSTKNHTVERMWPEVNKRVNFPIKRALIQMVDQESLDMEDGLTRYCLSNLTCQISQIGVQRFVHAWNSHYITGKGIPNLLARDGCKTRIVEELLLRASEAAELYHQEMGQRLTSSSAFGIDPFRSEEDKIRAETEFNSLYFDLEDVLNYTVNEYCHLFQDCLTQLINITRRYA